MPLPLIWNRSFFFVYFDRVVFEFHLIEEFRWFAIVDVEKWIENLGNYAIFEEVVHWVRTIKIRLVYDRRKKVIAFHRPIHHNLVKTGRALKV